MELIRPPRCVRGYLVRSDAGNVCANVVSELGVFGWALFGGGKGDEGVNRLDGWCGLSRMTSMRAASLLGLACWTCYCRLQNLFHFPFPSATVLG